MVVGCSHHEQVVKVAVAGEVAVMADHQTAMNQAPTVQEAADDRLQPSTVVGILKHDLAHGSLRMSSAVSGRSAHLGTGDGSQGALTLELLGPDDTEQWSIRLSVRARASTHTVRELGLTTGRLRRYVGLNPPRTCC